MSMLDNVNIVRNSQGISFDIKLPKVSNRHSLMISKMIKNDMISGLRYIQTFKGRRERIPVEFAKPKSYGTDLLSLKRNGTILKQFKELFKYDGKSARPTTTDNDYIGVEIECMIPRLDECDEDSGCDCGDDDCCNTSGENADMVFERLGEVFFNKRIKNVRIKHDVSVTNTSKYCGLEVVVLTRLSDMSNLKAVCDALSEVGAKVDSSCGLHVHLDAREGDGRVMANRLVRALPLLNLMVPATRLNNQYCGEDRSRRGNRYAKVNTTSIRKYGTVEVRMHSGTTDFIKISNWAIMLSLIAHQNRRMMKPVSLDNKEYFFQFHNFNKTLSDYIITRIKKFNKDRLNTYELEKLAYNDREEHRRLQESEARRAA